MILIMIKVRISIAIGDCNTYYDYSADFNGSEGKPFIDEYIEAELPALPRIEDNFHLGEEHSKQLAKIIASNKRTEEYNEGWCDYNDLDEEGNPKIKYLSVKEDEIADETEIVKVQFMSDWDFVWIVVG